MERRDFLLALAAGTAAVLSGCARPVPAAQLPSRSVPSVPPTTEPAPVTTPLQVSPSPVAGLPRLDVASPHKDPGIIPPPVIDTLPEQAGTSRLALTIDDGVSTPVLDAYLDFIVATGVRATFFVNGVYESWTTLRPKLAPLVDSGQAQLGNHTWDHPSVTGLTGRQIEQQIRRNDDFLNNTFGLSGRPYFRPPYGHHDVRTDRVTADLGYPHTVMWFGSLGDAALLSPAQIVANAEKWFLPRHIVIGHANRPPITYVFGQLAELIRSRSLQTVTLNDVFSPLA